MRLVKARLSAEQKVIAENIDKKYEVEDVDLVCDIMGLLHTRGWKLISASERNRLLYGSRNKNTVSARSLINAQYSFLRSLKEMALFHKFCEVAEKHSLEEATDRLVALMRAMHRKERESFCTACQLQSGCSFGLFTTQPNKYPGYNAGSPKHQDCPMNAQQAVGSAVLQQGLTALIALIDPAMLAMVAGKSGHTMMVGMAKSLASPQGSQQFDATFTGRDIMQAMGDIVDKLTSAQLAIFQIARTIETKVKVSKGRKLEKSTDPTKAIDMVKMESVADVTKAPPSVNVLPDVLKQYRIGTSALQVRQNMQLQEKKQLFYVLLDSSGSMSGGLATNKNGFLCRAHVASALSLAVIKKTIEEKGMMYFRFFAGSPDYLHKATNLHDLVDLSRQIGIGDFNGGSTSLQKALSAAFADIQKGKDTISKAEVLLITDGCASVEEGILKKEMKGTKLHVLEITEKGSGVPDSRKVLKRLAETYVETNPDEIDFNKIASVV